MRILLIAAAFSALAPLARAVVITDCNEQRSEKRSQLLRRHSASTAALRSRRGPLAIAPIPGITIINGNGFAVTLGGGNAQGVVNIPYGARLYLSGVTIANGLTPNSTGGGSFNGGELVLSRCTFVGNTNAILNTGNLSVTSSKGSLAPGLQCSA